MNDRTEPAARGIPAVSEPPGPPAGPLETPPPGFFTPQDRRRWLDEALAGVPLGAWDHRIADWVLTWDDSVIVTVVSLLARCREVGRREAREALGGPGPAAAALARGMLAPDAAGTYAAMLETAGPGTAEPAGQDMRADRWQAVTRQAGHTKDVPVAGRSRLHDTRTGAVWTFERVLRAPSPGFGGAVEASRPDGTAATLPPGRLGLRLVPKP